MKNFKTSAFTLLSVIILFVCSEANAQNGYTYKPDSQELYNTIVHMDSVYFNAYNTCDMKTQAAIYSENIEFYHDKGGLMTSKQDILDAIKKNICGKVTREIVPGSVEVYPIHDYGAIEIGLHKFHNNQEKDSGPSKISKFIIIWQHKDNRWQIARVVSLH